MPVSERITQAASASAVALGVAAATAPQPFGRSFGFRATDPETHHVTRLWGTRTAAIGAIGLVSGSAQRRQFLATVGALNLADVILGLRSDEISSRARALSTGTSAVFAALCAVALAGER